MREPSPLNFSHRRKPLARLEDHIKKVWDSIQHERKCLAEFKAIQEAKRRNTYRPEGRALKPA